MKSMTSNDKQSKFVNACLDKFESDSKISLTIHELKEVASTFV